MVLTTLLIAIFSKRAIAIIAPYKTSGL